MALFDTQEPPARSPLYQELHDLSVSSGKSRKEVGNRIEAGHLRDALVQEIMMQQVKVLLAFMDRGEAGTPPAVETFAAVAKKVDSVTKNLQDGTSVDIAQTLNTDVEYLTILKKIAGLDTEDEGIDFTEGDNLSSLTTLIMKTNASSEGIADPDKWMKDEFAKLSDEIFPPDIDYTRLSAIDTTVMAVDILKAQSRRQNSSFSLRPDNLAKDEPTTHRVAQAKYLAENAVKKFTEASKGDEPALHLFDKKAEGLKKKVDEIGAAIVKLDEKKTQLETDMRALKVERSNLNFGRMIESGDFSEVEGLTKKMRKLVDTSPSISSIYANASIANDAARAIAVALVDEVNAAIAGIPETEESNNISELIDVATRQTTRTKLGKLRETTEGINRFDDQTTLGQIEVFKKSIQASITAIDSTPRSMNIEIDAIAKSERDAKDAAKKLANHKKQIGMVADLCRNLQAYRDAPEPKPVQLREQLRNDAVITRADHATSFDSTSKAIKSITGLSLQQTQQCMSELASLEAQIAGYIRAVEPKAKNGKEVEDLIKAINVELDKKPKSASETPDVPPAAGKSDESKFDMLKKEGIKTKEGAKKVMGEVTSKAIAATPMAKEFVAGLNAKAKENFDKAHPPRPQKVAGAVDPSTPVVASEPAPTPAPAPAVEQAVPVAVSSEPAPVAATEAAPAASTSVSTATETRADDPETKESATAKISALFSESAMLIYESDEMNYSTKYKSQDDLRKLLKRVKRGLNRGVSPSDSIKEFKLGAEAIVNEYTNSGHTTKASPYETVPTRRDAISESATELAAVVEAGAAQDAQVPSEDAGVTTEKEVLSVDDLPLVGTVTDTKWKPSTATAASVKPEAVVASSAVEINNISTPDDAKAILTELSAAGADEIRKQAFIEHLKTPGNLIAFINLLNEKAEIIPLINIIKKEVVIEQATFQEVITKMDHDFAILKRLWSTLGENIPVLECTSEEIDKFVENQIQAKTGEDVFAILLNLLELDKIKLEQLSDSTLKIIFADSSISGFRELKKLLNKDNGLEFAQRAKSAIDIVLTESKDDNVLATLRRMLKEVEEKIKSQVSPTAPAAAPAGEATAAAKADVVAAAADTKITAESGQDKARKFWEGINESHDFKYRDALKDIMQTEGIDAPSLTVDIAAKILNNAGQLDPNSVRVNLLSANPDIASFDLIRKLNEYNQKANIFKVMIDGGKVDTTSAEAQEVAKDIFLGLGFVENTIAELSKKGLLNISLLSDSDIFTLLSNTYPYKISNDCFNSVCKTQNQDLQLRLANQLEKRKAELYDAQAKSHIDMLLKDIRRVLRESRATEGTASRAPQSGVAAREEPKKEEIKTDPGSFWEEIYDSTKNSEGVMGSLREKMDDAGISHDQLTAEIAANIINNTKNCDRETLQKLLDINKAIDLYDLIKKIELPITKATVFDITKNDLKDVGRKKEITLDIFLLSGFLPDQVKELIEDDSLDTKSLTDANLAYLLEMSLSVEADNSPWLSLVLHADLDLATRLVTTLQSSTHQRNSSRAKIQVDIKHLKKRFPELNIESPKDTVTNVAAPDATAGAAPPLGAEAEQKSENLTPAETAKAFWINFAKSARTASDEKKGRFGELLDSLNSDMEVAGISEATLTLDIALEMLSTGNSEYRALTLGKLMTVNDDLASFDLIVRLDDYDLKGMVFRYMQKNNKFPEGEPEKKANLAKDIFTNYGFASNGDISALEKEGLINTDELTEEDIHEIIQRDVTDGGFQDLIGSLVKTQKAPFAARLLDQLERTRGGFSEHQQMVERIDKYCQKLRALIPQLASVAPAETTQEQGAEPATEVQSAAKKDEVEPQMDEANAEAAPETKPVEPEGEGQQIEGEKAEPALDNLAKDLQEAYTTNNPNPEQAKILAGIFAETIDEYLNGKDKKFTPPMFSKIAGAIKEIPNMDSFVGIAKNVKIQAAITKYINTKYPQI